MWFGLRECRHRTKTNETERTVLTDMRGAAADAEGGQHLKHENRRRLSAAKPCNRTTSTPTDNVARWHRRLGSLTTEDGEDEENGVCVSDERNGTKRALGI